MIYQDLHVHTHYSSDSSAVPAEMVEAALAKGLKRICFTDHMDIGLYDNGRNLFDPEARFKELNEVRALYKDRIEIGIGVELGLMADHPELHDRIAETAEKYPWDFRIGSTHAVFVGEPGAEKPYDPAYAPAWEWFQTTEEAFSCYYETILKNVQQYDCYETVGHLDYMVRYLPDGFEPYVMEDYHDLIDEILRTIIAKGKALEVNTSSLHYPIRRTNPEKKIIDRYFALGGARLTFGSDAHRPEHVGYGFETLME